MIKVPVLRSDLSPLMGSTRLEKLVMRVMLGRIPQKQLIPQIEIELPRGRGRSTVHDDDTGGMALRPFSGGRDLLKIRIFWLQIGHSNLTRREWAKKEQVRLVSVEAERPNHPSRRGGGQPARGGVLHDNDTYVTP